MTALQLIQDPVILLIAWPLLAGPLVYFAGRLSSRSRAVYAVVRWLGVVVLLAAWAPWAATARLVLQEGVYTRMVGTVLLRVDGLSVLLAAVALALGTLGMLFSLPDSAEMDPATSGVEKHHALLISMVGMIIGLGSVHDLFNLWVWFEGMAICSYLLVAFRHERPTTLEASVKLLVQSATGSILVLLGIALIFAQTGELDLETLAATLPHSTITLAAGALLTIGFGVKVAMAPLHTWLPDAHAEAPSAISAMLSGVVIEAGLVALLRILPLLTGAEVSWGMLLMSFGAANMLLGNLLALRQSQVKRMLAYSSLSHIGYMLMGFGIAFQTGVMAGAQGGAFHLVTHGLMKGLAFLAAGSLLYALSQTAQPGEHDPSHEHEHGLSVADLAGASRRYPLAALALSLAVLSLAGLPPLAGFVSKWQIFVAGFAAHDAVIAGFVLFAALNSVLSLAYYAPLVNAVYRLQPSGAVQQGRALPRLMGVPLLLLTAAVVAMGIWPGLVAWLTELAGAAVVTALHV